MKKVYQKPYLVVESFQLSAAIAAACSTAHKATLNHDINTCQHDATGYFGDPDVCGIDVTDSGGDSTDTFCYHGPFVVNDTFLAS